MPKTKYYHRDININTYNTITYNSSYCNELKQKQLYRKYEIVLTLFYFLWATPYLCLYFWYLSWSLKKHTSTHETCKYTNLSEIKHRLFAGRKIKTFRFFRGFQSLTIFPSRGLNARPRQTMANQLFQLHEQGTLETIF